MSPCAARHEVAAQRTPARRARAEQLIESNCGKRPRRKGRSAQRARAPHRPAGDGQADVRSPAEGERESRQKAQDQRRERRTIDPQNRNRTPRDADTRKRVPRRKQGGGAQGTPDAQARYVRGVPWGRPQDGHAPHGLHPARHRGCDRRAHRIGRGGHRRAPKGEPMSDETDTYMQRDLLFVPIINSEKMTLAIAYVKKKQYLCSGFRE